jgi:hypothetical protein
MNNNNNSRKGTSDEFEGPKKKVDKHRVLDEDMLEELIAQREVTEMSLRVVQYEQIV